MTRFFNWNEIEVEQLSDSNPFACWWISGILKTINRYCKRGRGRKRERDRLKAYITKTVIDSSFHFKANENKRTYMDGIYRWMNDVQWLMIVSRFIHLNCIIDNIIVLSLSNTAAQVYIMFSRTETTTIAWNSPLYTIFRVWRKM